MLGVNDGFGHTCFVAVTPNVGGGDFAIPQPESIWNAGGTKKLGPSIDPVNKLLADELILDAPIGNALNIYVDLEGVAAVGLTDLILRPGDSKRVSGANKTTLNAIAQNGTDLLEIQAHYR
jgi:hypothetical protein